MFPILLIRTTCAFAPSSLLGVEFLLSGGGRRRGANRSLLPQVYDHDPLAVECVACVECADKPQPQFPSPEERPKPSKQQPPEKTLPTPTDVPVPEPWDIPPPDPKDPRPKSIP